MLGESLSRIEAKDRYLGSIVAEDDPRYDSTGLNVDHGSDLRKYDVWHPALLS
jgi:hypothetical protein